MIVTCLASATAVYQPAGGTSLICGLAARGLLHSECEAFDHVTLGATQRFAPTATAGTESAIFVTFGALFLEAPAWAGMTAVRAGELLLLPLSTPLEFTAGLAGCELLWLVCYPKQISSAMPTRRPEVPAIQGGFSSDS